MQIINNKNIQLHIGFTLNPLKWGINAYQDAWVREDDTHRAHGVKLLIANIGPFNEYLQVMTKEPIDDELREDTWPGKKWEFNAPTNYWSKSWKLGGEKK